MRVFVVSRLSKDIIENKPGCGSYTIPAGERVEIVDVIGKRDIPGRKDKEDYVKHTALEIANAIVQDYKESGLSVVVEDEKPVPPVPVSPVPSVPKK